MKSLYDVMGENMDMAVKIGYGYGYGLATSGVFIENKTFENLVWKLIDFGYIELERIQGGRCSLQEQIDFSMKDFELKVLKNHRELKRFCKKNGILI